MESDLGLTPTNDGQIDPPPDPAAHRGAAQGDGRLVHKMAEEGQVAVRNVRRDVLNEMKRAEKDGEVSHDEPRAAEDEVQKLTDAEVKAIDELMDHKEAEILEV